MKKSNVPLVVIFSALAACSWQVDAADVPTGPLLPIVSDSQNQAPPTKLVSRAVWHKVTVEPDPKLKARIHFYDKLNPVWWVRNLAEPVAPSWYRPGDPQRNLKYHLRNPGDNFCRFVIGVADKKFVRSGRYPERIANPNGGLNFAISRRKLLVLPFVDYRFKRFEIYFGWREHGSFGLAFRHRPRLGRPAAGTGQTLSTSSGGFDSVHPCQAGGIRAF